MSIRLMSLVWDVEFPTQSQLLVALKLADYANDQGGSIYPSRNRMAQLTQSSESTVKNVLRAFRAVGLIIVTKEGGLGPRATTHYELNLRLLNALHAGQCNLRGNCEELNIVWADKGSEFDPLMEGSAVDPLDEVRGQSGALRGQPGDAKGSAGYPQSTTTHQIDSSLARAGACEASATPTRAKGSAPKAQPLIVRKGDALWLPWLATLSAANQERAEASGAIEVPSEHPSPGAQPTAILKPRTAPGAANGASPPASGARPPGREAEFVVARGDPSWPAWLETFNDATREKAERLGAVAATSRWPDAGGRFLRCCHPQTARA